MSQPERRPRARKGSAHGQRDTKAYQQKYYEKNTRVNVSRKPFHALLVRAFALYTGPLGMGALLEEIATPALEAFIKAEEQKLADEENSDAQ